MNCRNVMIWGGRWFRQRSQRDSLHWSKDILSHPTKATPHPPQRRYHHPPRLQPRLAPILSSWLVLLGVQEYYKEVCHWQTSVRQHRLLAKVKAKVIRPIYPDKDLCFLWQHPGGTTSTSLNRSIWALMTLATSCGILIINWKGFGGAGFLFMDLPTVNLSRYVISFSTNWSHSAILPFFISIQPRVILVTLATASPNISSQGCCWWPLPGYGLSTIIHSNKVMIYSLRDSQADLHTVTVSFLYYKTTTTLSRVRPYTTLQSPPRSSYIYITTQGITGDPNPLWTSDFHP